MENHIIFCVILLIVFFIFINMIASKYNKHEYRKMYSYKLHNKLLSFNHKARLSYMHKIEPFLFEEYILTTLKAKKYRIKRNKKYTGDGGIDGRYKNKIFESWKYIQIKRYKNNIPSYMIYDFNELCLKHKTFGLFIYIGNIPKTLDYNKLKCIKLVYAMNL